MWHGRLSRLSRDRNGHQDQSPVGGLSRPGAELRTPRLLVGAGAASGQKSALPRPAEVGAKVWSHIADPFYDNGPNDKGIGIQLGYSLARVLAGYLLAALVAIPAGFLIGIFHALFKPMGDETLAEAVGMVAAVVGYVVMMLGYSTIYQVVVKLRLWKLSFETAELSGLAALDDVKAAGVASSAFGEGLADALDVGGL